MKDETPLVIRDNESIKNIFIQVDLKNQSTSVCSNFSSGENLSLIMEALAITAEKCIKDGIEKKKVYGTIKDYLVKVLGNYVIK